MPIPIICIIGKSKSGKTTLMEKIITELKRRKYRVGTIKHHSHAGFDIDYPGKDSWRHAQAGSDHVIIAAPDKVAEYWQLDREYTLDELAVHIDDVDIILAEGYRQAGKPTIEIVRAERGSELISEIEKLLAVATDIELNLDVPCFDLNDTIGLSDFIETKILRPKKRTVPKNSDPQISYAEAHQLTLSNIPILPSEQVELPQLNGRVLAEDIYAMVNSPSADVSLKDGYAIKSADIAQASLENPIELKLVGSVAAGENWYGKVEYGTAVRVLSGAPIPPGAQAVVSEEFTSVVGNQVVVTANAEPGRNILPKGTDVHQGELLVAAGGVLMPAHIGLLASAGYTSVSVIRRPQIAIIATGDEVVAPGGSLANGKLFASNMVTLAAWCNYYGMKVTTSVIADDPQDIKEGLLKQIANHDALITSGGAWSGDRDYVIDLLDELGWTKIYHRVRIGPGKAVSFGLWGEKPVFCLPGGPPSNYMAFLQLALPGLQRYAGYRVPGLKTITAELSKDVHGLINWTQFKFGLFEFRKGLPRFHPIKGSSRLQDMARAEGVLMIPEGVEHISAGEVVKVQILAWSN